MGGYSLPLKNRDMFRDLKKGFQVYTLDTSDVPVFRMGNVVNVSEPRFQQPQMGQMGQYQQLQDRVIDLTVEINGSSMTYVVPESRDVAMSNNITLACSVDPIMNQLNAAKRTSSDILDSIDKHRRTLEDAKQMFDKCGAKKPDNATWGDIQYLFAMFYSDYFPKVLDCDQKIVKAVLAYLEDPDAPEGTAFVRYLAVRCFVGDTIKWSDMI